jgi:sigma-E factor negative regulatory protein RseA
MSSRSESDLSRLEQLSALVDGELDDAAAAAACAGWSGDRSWRSSWHAYHLIGDVLRSEDLAADPQRDADLFARLRARLATEPVVIAPNLAPLRQQVGVGSPQRRNGTLWKGSAAVAAGFVAVAGVFMLTRPVEPVAPAGTTLARADGPIRVAASAMQPVAPVTPTEGSGGVPLRTAESSAGVPSALIDGRLIRDARLDSYLAAHKQFAGSSALGVPSAFLRSATVESTGR